MQTFLLVVGTFIPYIGNILYFLWLSKYTAFDPTPISFAIAGLLYAWSMFRYGLFDIVPMARERLISEMADGIMVLDDRGRVIDMNRSAREMLGLEGGFGQPLETMLAAWPELSRFCQEAPGEAAEIRVDRPAGGLWLNVDISPLHDKNGAVTGKLVMLRNITKRKMAENALEESRASFKTMFDAANDLLYIIDHQGRFLEVNNAVIAQLGYTREELIGSSPLRLMSAYDDCVVKEYPPLRPMRYPITLRAKDGKQLMVETHVVPGLWLGQPAVFGIARDMTEHMRQQEALRESNLALSAEVEERRRAEEKIASSLLEKEVMLKEIHHRVKNNMQIIISMLNLQKPSVVDARDQEIFLDCMSRIKSMALVHEKLYQSGDLGDIDFEDYIRSFVSYLFNAYVSDPAKVRLSVNVTKARWNIDKAVVLGLILNEIISNSIKYAFPDGREGNVFVNLGQGPDDTYVLEVGDTGVGIPEDTLKKNNSTLGLRLIKILAGQIDSELAIETAGGTRFRFSFRSDSNG
jgi:hypothetical protein